MSVIMKFRATVAAMWKTLPQAWERGMTFADLVQKLSALKGLSLRDMKHVLDQLVHATS
ncbi:hypothetical protein [Muricoccus aerilatus]|uniref:hypothetical protein n=1 Tax=Muricoccus aerilatus TaxID=452982 RepID=UPI000B0B227B|nr:hypothetical protein [Roseomonas aerilata]